MPISPSGIVYEHVSVSDKDRTPKESAPADGSFKGEIILHCDYADREALLTDIAAGQGMLYPYMPSTGAYAYSAGIIGIGATTPDPVTGLFVHDEAELRIFFNTAPGMATTVGLLFVERIQPGSRVISLPTVMLRWGSVLGAGTPMVPAEAPHFDEPLLEYIRTYPNVSIEDSKSYGYINTANSNVFSCLTLNHVFPIEHLRYIGPIAERKLQLGTLSKVSVSHHFLGRNVEWNKEFRAETGLYDYFHHTLGTGKVERYPPADHNLIFGHMP